MPMASVLQPSVLLQCSVLLQAFGIIAEAMLMVPHFVKEISLILSREFFLAIFALINAKRNASVKYLFGKVEKRKVLNEIILTDALRIIHTSKPSKLHPSYNKTKYDAEHTCAI